MTARGRTVLFIVSQPAEGEAPSHVVRLRTVGTMAATALEILALKRRLRET